MQEADPKVLQQADSDGKRIHPTTVGVHLVQRYLPFLKIHPFQYISMRGQPLDHDSCQNEHLSPGTPRRVFSNGSYTASAEYVTLLSPEMIAFHLSIAIDTRGEPEAVEMPAVVTAEVQENVMAYAGLLAKKALAYLDVRGEHLSPKGIMLEVCVVCHFENPPFRK